MNTNVKWALGFALLCVVCAIVWFMRGTGAGMYASIKQDGKVIKTIDLSKVTEPYEFDVISDRGGYNRICVEYGKIYVSAADCADKVCVKHGCAAGGAPVVCLPHRLSITVSGAASAPDAVSGGQ